MSGQCHRYSGTIDRAIQPQGVEPESPWLPVSPFDVLVVINDVHFTSLAPARPMDDVAKLVQDQRPLHNRRSAAATVKLRRWGMMAAAKMRSVWCRPALVHAVFVEGSPFTIRVQRYPWEANETMR